MPKAEPLANSLIVPRPYDFESSVRDHGWYALLPYAWLDDCNTLQRVERLDSGKVVLMRLSAARMGDEVRLNVDVQAEGELGKREQAEIRRKVRWILRLDEDMSEFYSLAATHPPLAEKVASGRGKLLRSPTLWEDVVKTICTTNTTWSQTKQMVARLVQRLGDPCPSAPDLQTFPTPDQVAAAGEAVFEADVRMGYRNAYVLQLAREICEGRRDVEALKESQLPLKELKRELKSIKGVGDYAAHTLLMILSRYDEIGVDSILRSHVTAMVGKTLNDREMVALYERWGRWKYLAYWFEMI